jgi:hypothetical protein
MDAPAFPGVLVEDGQHPQLAAAHRHIVDEVPGSTMIAMGRLSSAGPWRRPDGAPRLLRSNSIGPD